MNETAWELTTRLFASGDRKIEIIHVSDELPDPTQLAATYTRLAYLFGKAKETEENSDAMVHRIEIVIAPQVEPKGEK
jgi:hypothetical protein